MSFLAEIVHGSVCECVFVTEDNTVLYSSSSCASVKFLAPFKWLRSILGNKGCQRSKCFRVSALRRPRVETFIEQFGIMSRSP